MILLVAKFDTTVDPPFGDGTGNEILQSSPARSAPQSVEVPPGESIGRIFDTFPTTFYWLVYFWVDANPSSDQLLFDTESPISGVAIHLKANGRLAWNYDDGAYIDTGADAVTLGAWNKLLFKVVIHATTGGMELSLNDVQQFSNFTEDTESAGTADSMFFGPWTGGDQSIFFDDMVLRDDAYPTDDDEHVLWLSGVESGVITDDFSGGSGVTADTTHARTGVYAAQADSTEYIYGYPPFDFKNSLAFKVWVYIPALPSLRTVLCEATGSSQDWFRVLLNTDGTLSWGFGNNTPIETGADAIVTGAFNEIIGTAVVDASVGGMSVRLNGVEQFASFGTDTSTGLLTQIMIGPAPGGGQTFWYDDMVVRDTDFPAPVETVETAQFEALATAEQSDRFLYESLGTGLAAVETALLESLGVLVLSDSLLLEALLRVVAVEALPIESGGLVLTLVLQWDERGAPSREAVTLVLHWDEYGAVGGGPAPEPLLRLEWDEVVAEPVLVLSWDELGDGLQTVQRRGRRLVSAQGTKTP